MVFHYFNCFNAFFIVIEVGINIDPISNFVEEASHVLVLSHPTLYDSFLVKHIHIFICVDKKIYKSCIITEIFCFYITRLLLISNEISQDGLCIIIDLKRRDCHKSIVELYIK
uniref:Putative ovule protein n=1 Tax=Solanum chacoense TaxID=4108 RepID=A0A0V0HRV8_SOLCH